MRVWQDLPKSDEIPLLMCLHGLCIGLEHTAIEFLFRLGKKKKTFFKEEDFSSQEDELTALRRLQVVPTPRSRPASQAEIGRGGRRTSARRSGARGARAAAPSLCRLLLRTAR